jgi:hypothetical protein
MEEETKTEGKERMIRTEKAVKRRNRRKNEELN